jgi:TfoX/Sxy family transcriptional regulator of competence genes
MEEITLKKYTSDKKNEWDNFITHSKNGTFLFYRRYMEYHSDRYKDYSLMFYKGQKLIAVLPGNIEGDTLFSHSGLTFGGIITGNSMNVTTMLKIFEVLLAHLKAESIRRLVYKRVPYIYHSYPAEEDLYALFRFDAKLVRRDVTTAIYMPERIQFHENRRRSIKKAESKGIDVTQTEDFAAFWPILEENLAKRYSTKPVHTLNEIKYLHSLFPNNIRLFTASKQGETLGGVVIYESKHVAHAQYVACNEKGRRMSVLDLIFRYLIEEYYKDKRYFDFGISTEQNGYYLNRGLVFYKESFGGRAVVHDFYEVHVQ